MGCCGDEEQEPPQPGGSASERCTDVLWLIIFVFFWIFMIIIAVFAFAYGNPLRVINGYDSYGNTCGVKNNAKLSKSPESGISTLDKRYLLFMDIEHLRTSLKICVAKCPKKTLRTIEDLQLYYKETGISFCSYGFDLEKADKNDKSLSSLTGPCPNLPIYESIPILHRCFPKPRKEVVQQVFSKFYNLLNSWETVEYTLSDLYSSWKELLIFLFVALGVSFVMVCILHLMATLVSWIFMIVVSISCILGTALLWYTYYEIKHGLREMPDNMILLESLRNEKAFLWYSIIATILTVIILLLVFVMRKKVAFLAALFKETAKCLGSIPGLFIQPIITFAFLLVFFLFWLTVIVCLATANYPGAKKQMGDIMTTSTPFPPGFKTNLDPTTKNTSISLSQTYQNYIEYVDDSWVKGMWWFYIIGLIWTSEFILACQQMTIAGAVSHWYFRGSHADSSPVIYSAKNLMKYHIGSVAKGSFLITLFKIPRLILTYLHTKLKFHSDQGSECAKCGLKCGICCFYCLEKFISYLNHNAYTIITIEGVHFCKAAAKAFSALMSNALHMIMINSVGDFILFLGKCTVTAVTGSLGLIMLKRNPELHFYAAPTLVICVFSFFIAHCILSLYEMVVDTLFICVCEDKNINGADGRWNQTALASFADEPPPRKSKSAQSEALPATELDALKTDGADAK
ncbi:choline transporter-like 1 [Arctopsyche grandis]|uniref:choline transporter-like 1 n=1 Tax=Arctopsyche grandis TaxID=121162 RepID=UPI00406D67AB